MYVHSIFHHWACILIFEGHFIEYVCLWEFVCELSNTLHSLYSLYLFLEWETDNLLLGHCLFNHYIHWWYEFTPYFDLSWLSFFFICSLFRHHTHYCFQFIPFVSPLVLFLQQPIPSLLFSLDHSYTSHYQFDFLHCLIITIIFT